MKSDADGEMGWTEIEACIGELKRITRAILRARGPQTMMTTELLQTTLRRMFQNRDERWDYERVWENRAHVVGTFRKAVRSALTDHHRKRLSQKRDSGKPSVSLETLQDAPDSTLQDPESCLSLLDCIDAVSADDAQARELLELKYVWGFSAEELVQITGIPRTTAAPRLSRLVQSLARCLDLQSSGADS
jgi:RNA polymerase sigma factor (sigma-70 family)